MVSDDKRQAYEKTILDNVEQHGWFCASVFDPDKKLPNFSYTVGLSETLGCPELFIAGLPMKLTHSILWTAFEHIKAGKLPEPDEPWKDILDGYDMVYRPVHSSQIETDYFNSARWFWNTQKGNSAPLKANQLFWPSGETSLFHWDEGCEADVIADQPRLDLPRTEGA
jgi:hypothetical protein